MKRRLTMLMALAFSTVCTAAAFAQDDRPAPRRTPDQRFMPNQRPAPDPRPMPAQNLMPGQRYMVVPYQESMLLVDTQTGDCWMLRKADVPYEPPTWQEIPRALRDGQPISPPARQPRDGDQPVRERLEREHPDQPHPERIRERDSNGIDRWLTFPAIVESKQMVESLEKEIGDAKSRLEKWTNELGQEHPNVRRVQELVQVKAAELQREAGKLIEMAENQLDELRSRDQPRSEEGRYQLRQSIEAIERLIERYRGTAEDRDGR